MFLVNPYIGNMDLIPPGSFESDPPSTYTSVYLVIYCHTKVGPLTVNNGISDYEY